MVLLELAIGKGAVLAGLAKAGSLGVAGKGAATLLAPSHGLWESLQVLPAQSLESISACGQHLSSIASGAMLALTELTEIERTSLGVATTSAGLVGLMHACGFFSTSEKDEHPQEGEEAKDQRQSHWVLPVAIRFCAVTDCCMAGIVVHSVGQFVAVPLRTWVLGGLLLSFPVSWLVRKLVERFGFRRGFFLESAAVAAAFAWLSWGTSLLIQYPQGMHTAPLLWWTVFGQCVLTWSCLSVAVSAMILTTVLALLPAMSS